MLPRRETLRRRLPLALVLVAAVLVVPKWLSSSSATAVVEVQVATSMTEVSLELLAVNHTERLAFWTGAPDAVGVVRWRLQVEPGAYDLLSTLRGTSQIAHDRRTIFITDGATIHADLRSNLRPPNAPAELPAR